MEEIKQISLSELGLEVETTPAEKAAANENAVEVKPITEEPPVATVSKSSLSDTVEPAETKAAKSSLAEIAKNTAFDEEGLTQYGEVIRNVDKIAKKPKTKMDDPIRKNIEGLVDLADHEIERTKAELTGPEGIITKGKEEYVNRQYDRLMSRAKNTPRLAEFIKKIEEIIETEPRFDGITEYERKGYILFTVARDKTVETDNNYFGLKEQTIERIPRMSSDVAKEVDSFTSKEDEDDDLSLFDDDSVELGVSPKSALPMQGYAEDEEIKEEASKKEADDTKVSNSMAEKEIKEDTTDEEDVTYNAALAEEEDPEEKELMADVESDEPELTDEEIKELSYNYKSQVMQELKLEREGDLDGFAISNKPIKLKSALQVERSSYTVTWGLQYTGKPIEMTPISGEELLQLNPQNTDMTSINGLRTIFNIMYRHTVGKKPDIDTWLKQISVYDLDCMIFAMYMANFKDTNYLSYQCPNNKCNNLFINKKDVKDMVVYPNDEVKQRFEDILHSRPVKSKLFRTKPIQVSRDYAFSFCTESIYGDMIERAALTDEFASKYANVVQIMANIDTIYKIDNVSKQLYPIDFGVVEDSLSKTVMRKVKAIYEIMKNLSSDEHATLMGEVYKITRTFTDDKISYQIPSTTCGKCNTTIEATPQGALQLLFTRAFLPIGALSIQ